MAVPVRKFERQISESSVDSLKTLNDDLREHLTKLRTQLESQKGTVKHTHWQKVLDVRLVREQEQQKYATTLAEIRGKFQTEKNRELDNQRDQLLHKHEHEMQRVTRIKDMEITKLKHDLEQKESLLCRLIADSRRDSLRLSQDGRKVKLLNELSHLRSTKKQLEESLTSASEAERQYCRELRKTAEHYQSEVVRVRRESHIQIRRMIEQLKSKDKIISHLERELGQRSGYALQLALERESTSSQDASANPPAVAVTQNMDLSLLSSGSKEKLGDGNGTKRDAYMLLYEGEGKRAIESIAQLETEVQELREKCDCLIQDNLELSKKLKDIDQKNRQLNEKNKKFLDKNVELTSQNRNLKDQTQLLIDDQRIAKEQTEHSKRQCQQLTKQLQQEMMERNIFAQRVEQMDTMKQQLTEQGKTIAALRQSCSEKDRRIELMQHRKKRRRIRRSQERCTGVKETFYGYDEDSKSENSENSLSSVSFGTLSDEELWDELAREEVEKNYQKLMKEYINLQRSHSLLLSQTGAMHDPQREAKTRIQLETDLLSSQGRIEELEKVLRDTGQGEACEWRKEKEQLFTNNEALKMQLHQYESENMKLSQDLRENQEQLEDLEFRVLELEECQTKECDCGRGEVTPADMMSSAVVPLEVESIQKSIKVLLADRQAEARELVQKLDKFRDAEQQIINLECTAKELQAKVISLQKEKTTLEEMLLSAQQGGIAASENRNECAEVLALKDQLSFHEKSEVELMEKNMKLQGKLDECEKQNNELVRRVQDLEEKMMKFQTKHGKPMNRTDSEKEKLQEKLYVTTSVDLPSKRDVNLQTYTKMLDKCVAAKYEERRSEREFELLDQRVQNLYEENLSLKQKLDEIKVLEDASEKGLDVVHDSRLVEMEEYCEDLQDRLQTAEMAERQLREKLKLAEHTINDLESSEGYFREKAEELGSREAEAKRQTAQLCQTVHELKEIILDKDIMETGLREKVDFLEKAELASAQIIQELQNNEKSLRRQLELKSEVEGDAKFADKLKKRISVLEKDNKKLSVRVSELEEDEEVLRENWRRVADEDANRIECLEQKVKMLDALNSQLKSSLDDVEDDMYIHNNVPQSSSLASELNESEKKNGDLTLAKRSFSTPYLRSVGYEDSNTMPPRSLSQRDLDLISESEGLEKIQQLEEQISNIVEDKNSKLETLHEKIANLRENELKLTETLMEMEHEERELKTKLALYESSQVTVEKMLQYENKIFELHSSQENLLDRLESLEDHDMTMQEKLEKAEQQCKIRVGTVEKQLKNVQTQLEQAKLRGEELTKEKELLKRQIDKLENKIRLYVRKGEEAKEKINELNGQISVYEQREQYASEKVREMEQSLSAIQKREGTSRSRIAELESELETLRQKEANARMKLETLKEELKQHEEKDSFSIARIQELEKHERELMEKVSEYAKLDTSSKQRICELENAISDYDSRMVVVQRDLSEAKENERSRLVTIENMERTQNELSESLKRLRVGEEGYVQQISKLELSKSQDLSQLEREKEELCDKVRKLESSVREHVGSVKYLEQKLADSQGCERKSVDKVTSLERTLSEYEEIVVLRTKEVKSLEKEKTELLDRMEMLNSETDQMENDNRQLKDHLWNLQQEKLALEKSVLEQEGIGGEHQRVLGSMKSSLNRLEESNSQYEEKVQTLSQDVKSYETTNHDLKLEMEKLNSLKDGLEKTVRSLREEVYVLESENQDLRTKMSAISAEKDEIQSSVDSLKCDVDFLNGVIGDLKFSVKTLENDKSEQKSQYDNLQTDCFDLRQKLTTSKSFDEESGKKLQLVSHKLESVENSKKELVKSVLTLESEKQKMGSELEKHKSECETMQVKWNESCENEKNLRDKLTLSKEKLNELQGKLQKSEEEIVLWKSGQELKREESVVLQQEQEQVIVKEKQKMEQQLRELQATHDRTSKKMGVLQDAEGRLMDRVMQLEQVEASLREQLDKSQRLQMTRNNSVSTEVSLLTDASSRPSVSDQSTSTDDLVSVSPPDSSRKVSGIFQRLQELESQNREMSLKLHDYDTATSRLKQLKEKVKLLEESEDKLMERVMELEENEESLKRDVGKLKRNASGDETDGILGSVSADSDTSVLSLKVEQLQKDKELIQEVLQEEQEKLDKVSKEKLILEEELQHLSERIQEEKQNLEEKVKGLERMNQKEQFKVDSLKSSEIVLKKDLETVKDEKKKLESENTDLQSQMIDLQSQIVDLENLVQEERHKVEIVNDKKMKLEVHVRTLERAKESERQKAEAYSHVEKRLVKSMSEEKRAVKEIEEELKNTQDKLKSVEAEYQRKISHLEKQNETLEQSEKQLKNAINTHCKTEQELQKQIDSMKTEIRKICDKSKLLEDKVSALQTENSSLVEKCAKLTKDNEELDQYMKSLKEDGDRRKPSSLHPVLPKIPATLTPAAARKEMMLKKPHPFAASKSLHSHRERDQSEQVLALETKQKELMETINKLEKENGNLKEGRTASGRMTSSLFMAPSAKKFGVSSGAKDSPSEDLVKKVQKLEHECSIERKKVKDVEDELSVFRGEVINLRDFVVTGKRRKSESLHPRSKWASSSTSLNQIPEIASLESELKQKLAEIQHREETIRSEISPISVEKLKHQVIELEASEARLKKKVVELQLSEEDLKKRVKDNEKTVLTRPRTVHGAKCDGNHAEFFYKIDNLKKREEELTRKIERLEQDAQNKDLSHKVDNLQQSEKKLKRQVERLETQQQSAANVAIATSADMLDKPEDVLKQQIKDLQKLEQHQREQICELEADREELHEIARRDKATIHDQNVRIRELQLSEKVLHEQMERMEAAEKSLYQKCEELESQVSKMEDQIHLLQIHERRLRELVKKLKLDEELWIAKSENMEMTVDELAASEANLRKRLEELATEKMTLAQKSEYLSLRCQELESSETVLFEKVKSYENVEVCLQNKLMVLENSEAAANSKISELDMMNMDISTRLQRAVEENAVLYNHIQGIQGNLQELNRQMLIVKDSEMGLKQEVESLEKSEASLQKKLKEFELRDIDSQAKARQLEQTEAIMKDRISNLQRSENKLKYRIQELENSTKNLDNATRDKLPRTLEECHQRIIYLQSRRAGSAQLPEESGAIMKVPKLQFAEMQAKMVVLEESERQMSEVKKLNAHLRTTIGQLRIGTGTCGHEVELDVCRDRISSYENVMQRLKQILPEEQVPSLLNPESDGSVQGSSEDLPARGLQSMESERVMQTMKGLTRSQGSAGPQPPTETAEDLMPSDLSSVEEEPIMKDQEQWVHTRPRVTSTSDRQPAGHLQTSDTDFTLEEHWKKIEAKKPRLEKKGELAGNWKSVAKAVPSSSARKTPGGEEELMIGVTLHSESEHSHYRSQNDSDSSRSSPLLHQAMAASQRTASLESEAPPLPKTLPPSLPKNVGSFEEGPYYVPSSDDERFTSRKVLNPKVAPSVDTQMTSTVSVDSVGDSGQGTMGTGSLMSMNRGSVIKNRIAQLERQLQSKSSGAESRTDEEDSAITWKHKAPKRIEIIEKENKVAKDDPSPATRRRQRINKLEKELEERRRCIETFESWMNRSEDVLRNQDKLCDRDIVQNLQSQLVTVKSELQHAGYRRDDIGTDPAALKTELDKRDREIINKTNEIEALSGKLAHWQSECQRTEEMRSNALDSLRCLEVEISHLQYADEQLKQLQKEYNRLREQLDDLQALCQEYKIVVSEKEDLEAEVESLRNRLRDLGVKEAENSALEGQLEGSSRLLSDRMERVEQLKHEVIHLQDKMTDIENQNSQLKTIQDDYNVVKSRFDEMEKLKNRALLSVAPLKAQIARLASKCREKDEFIRRLSDALRHSQSATNLAELQEELDQFETDTENEEYYRPVSPFIQARLESNTKPGKINVNSFLRSTSSSRRSSSSSVSDKDLSSDSGSTNKKRPKSADQLSGRRSPFHGILQRSINANNLSPRGTDGLGNSLKEKYGNLPDTSHFVAVTDYIPDILSTGGRPTLELHLKEGDKVKVTGSIDENGYYEGECNGKVGLVPASCLQPVGQTLTPTPKERRLKKLKDPPSHLDSSPEKVTEMYQQLQSPHLSPRQGLNSSSHSTSPTGHSYSPQAAKHSSSSTQTRSTKTPFKTTARSGPPDPPRQFHVERLVGETGIMLAWIPPALDELGNSNNSQVTGYRVYVNGRLCQQPSSPHLAKCVVDGIEQDQQQHFAIQTLASNGQTSGVVDTVYKPSDLPRWSEESEVDSNPDLSSILSSRQYDHGQRRLFLGVYDYNPHHHSPHDYAGYELAFKAGDIISVFGKLRPDGFYHGEVDSRRGLVPASFIEEVPSMPRQNQSTSGSYLSLSSPQGVPSHRRTPRSPRS